MSEINGLLSEAFSKIQYCDKILVASSDGLIITAYPDYNPDKNDSLAASSTSVLGLTAATSELAGKGDAEYVLIRSNNGFMMTLGQQNFSVLVMAGQKANLGMLLLQGQKLVEKLSGIIDEHIAPKKLEHPRIYARELGTIETESVEEIHPEEVSYTSTKSRDSQPESESPEQGIGIPAFSKPFSDYSKEPSDSFLAGSQGYEEEPIAIEPNFKPKMEDVQDVLQQPVEEITCHEECNECEECEEPDESEHFLTEPEEIKAKFWPEEPTRIDEHPEHTPDIEIEEKSSESIYSDRDLQAPEENPTEPMEEPIIEPTEENPEETHENTTTSPIVDLVLPKGIYINDVVLYSNKQGLENLVVHKEEEQSTQQEDQQQEEEQKPPETMPWFNFNNNGENKTQNPEEDEKPQKEGDLFDSY